MPDSRDSEAKTIVVEYQPTASSFRRATHAAWRSQGIFKLLFLLLFALAVAVSYALGKGADPAEQVPVILSLLAGAILFYTYPLIAYLRKADYRSPVRYEFGRNSLHFQRGSEDQKIDWTEVQEVAVSKHFLILTMPKRFQLAVPRANLDPDKEQHLRLLAATGGVPIRD